MEHPRRFKSAGFHIHLIYLGLATIALSELRVVDRAREGGHYVDPVTVANNFYGNLQQLNKHYLLFDTLQIIDTSESEHKVLAVFAKGEIASAVSAAELPFWFVSSLPNLVQKIRQAP